MYVFRHCCCAWLTVHQHYWRTVLLEPGPVTTLTVTCTCCFTQKHEKLAVGRSGIICPLLKSCVIINSLELCLSPEAWCLIPLQKGIFIPFQAFKYSQSLSNHC